MEQSSIFFQLKQLMDRIRTMGDAVLSTYGITFSQMRVLHVLKVREGQCAQQELEQALQVSRPTVVGLVARLEKTGFVTESWNGKKKIICLTEKASELEEMMKAGGKEMEKRLLEGLSPEELQNFSGVLRHMKRNLEKSEGGTAGV